MFRKGVSDINIERLGSHAMGDAVKDAEELFRNATRDMIRSAAEDKAEADKEEIEKRTDGIIERENYNKPKSPGAKGPVDLCSARTGDQQTTGHFGYED